MNRIIWLFRESRSGSTWLTSHLIKTLNKKSLFLDDGLDNSMSLHKKIDLLKHREQQDSDYDYILHTHIHELTSILPKYNNPIVLRCSRKNKFEQFLSWCSIKYSHYSFFNLQKNQSIEQNELYEQFISKKITITKADYLGWHRYEVDRVNRCWELAKPFENQIIYYEDMIDGTASIPSLNLHNIKMNDDNLILRLPESYKKEMILNYNEVKEWFSNAQH